MQIWNSLKNNICLIQNEKIKTPRRKAITILLERVGNHNLGRVWYFLKHLFGQSPTLHLVHRNLVRVCWPETEQTRHLSRFVPDSGQCCIFWISSLSFWSVADADRPLEIACCDRKIKRYSKTPFIATPVYRNKLYNFFPPPIIRRRGHMNLW